MHSALEGQAEDLRRQEEMIEELGSEIAGSAEGLLEVSLVLHEPTGVTPLAPDKLQGLKTRHVSTRGELTELEGENIIGVPVRHNSTGMRTCLDDARHWRENGICEPLEATARCHHKLVWVHPFANGNGRWARIMADAYLAPIDPDPFSRLVGRRNTDRRQRPPCAAYPGTAGSGRIREFGPLVELVRRYGFQSSSLSRPSAVLSRPSSSALSDAASSVSAITSSAAFSRNFLLSRRP